MKISRTLPQFRHDSALLAVTAKHEAEFYLVHGGNISKTAQIIIPRTQYSDREDYEAKGGLVFESGARIDKESKLILRSLIQEFTKKSRELIQTNGIGSIYLFVPKYLGNIVMQALPKAGQAMTFVIDGNYFKRHPVELLRKIQNKYPASFKA